MKLIHRSSLLLAACLVACSRAVAADPSFSVQVPGADKLSITPLAGWTHTTDRPPAGIPPTVDFTAPGGTVIKITFMPDAKKQFATAEELDKLVTKANQQYVANSVEKRVSLVRLPTSSGPGVYSTFSDPKLVNVAKPPAGDFRYVSSGAISVGRQLLIFSLLSNSRDNDEYRQALDFLVKGIRVAGGS